MPTLALQLIGAALIGVSQADDMPGWARGALLVVAVELLIRGWH